MPAGFWPPLKCQSGIMANSTMHQANAIPTQTRSPGWAGFHQTPLGETMAECMDSSGQRCGGERADLEPAPAGVEDEHHQQAEDQQQERIVEQPLQQGRPLGLWSAHADLAIRERDVGGGGAMSATMVVRKKRAIWSDVAFHVSWAAQAVRSEQVGLPSRQRRSSTARSNGPTTSWSVSRVAGTSRANPPCRPRVEVRTPLRARICNVLDR